MVVCREASHVSRIQNDGHADEAKQLPCALRTFCSKSLAAGVYEAGTTLCLKPGARAALITLPLNALDIPTAISGTDMYQMRGCSKQI